MLRLPFASITRLPPRLWNRSTYESIRPAVVGPNDPDARPRGGPRHAAGGVGCVGVRAGLLGGVVGRAVQLPARAPVVASPPGGAGARAPPLPAGRAPAWRGIRAGGGPSGGSSPRRGAARG